MLLGRLQQLLRHRASCGRRLLDRALDGPELTGAASRPGEETLWAAAHDLNAVAARHRLSIAVIGTDSREIEVRAERRWVCGAEAQV